MFRDQVIRCKFGLVPGINRLVPVKGRLIQIMSRSYRRILYLNPIGTIPFLKTIELILFAAIGIFPKLTQPGLFYWTSAVFSTGRYLVPGAAWPTGSCSPDNKYPFIPALHPVFSPVFASYLQPVIAVASLCCAIWRSRPPKLPYLHHLISPRSL